LALVLPKGRKYIEDGSVKHNRMFKKMLPAVWRHVFWLKITSISKKSSVTIFTPFSAFKIVLITYEAFYKITVCGCDVLWLKVTNVSKESSVSVHYHIQIGSGVSNLILYVDEVFTRGPLAA
jgi:hypothetical protein